MFPDVNLEITEQSINLNDDSPEKSISDQKLHLYCKVEIPDIRETLYCYQCGEWSLTAEDLLCHTINHSESSIDVEQSLKIESNISNKSVEYDLFDKFCSKKDTLNIQKTLHDITLSCETCRLSFGNERACELHMLKHADILSHDTPDALQIKREKEYDEESGYDFLSESLINEENISENEQYCMKDKQLLPCKVEIPDIRDELYCYQCGEWCITADALHSHKLQMHGFICQVDEHVFEQFQEQNHQIHPEGLNRTFDESVFEKFSAENQNIDAYNEESQKEKQIYNKYNLILEKAQETKQRKKGEHQKRNKVLKEQFNCNSKYKCDICNKSFPKKCTLNIHKSKHIIQPFSCELCGLSFHNERTCAIHVLTHAGIQPLHDKTSNEQIIKHEKEFQKEISNLTLNENLDCDVSEINLEEFQAVKRIKKEKKIESEQYCMKGKQLLPCKVEIPDIRDELYCCQCGEWCITANALHSHKLQMHGFICKVDEHVFEQFQAQNHQIHPEGLNRTFDESVFEKFSAENQNIDAYNEESQKENQIHNKNNLILKKAQETKQRKKGEHQKRKKVLKEQFNCNSKYKCDICDKSFPKKCTLNIHKSKHIIQPFSCELCGLSFHNERTCAIHVLTHAGFQPHHYNTSEEPLNKGEKESQDEISNLTLNENLYCDVSERNNQQLNPRLDKPLKENQSVKNMFYYEVDESVFEQFQAKTLNCYTNNDELQEQKHNTYVCDYCRRHFSKKLTLIRHIQNKCSINCKSQNAKNKHRREQRSNNSFSCDLCNKFFTSKATLRLHKLLHEAKPFSCEICGSLFKTERACAIHELKHATKKIEKQSCNICGRAFKSKKELDKHNISHTKRDLTYICELCGRQFSSKPSLTKHIKCGCGSILKNSNRNEKHKRIRRGSFPCDLCNKTFTRQWCLDVHKPLHKIKPFSCEICDRLFDSKKACEFHELLKHAGVKPYQCDQREKTFAVKLYLEIHMDKHRGLKPYSCDTCKRWFRYEGNLKAHNRNFHNASKAPQNFTCDNCGRSFAFKKYLKKHIAIHYQKSRFPCEHCGRPFRLERELESHVLNKHTVLKPFECEQCTKTFGTKIGLNSHMRSHDDTNKKYQCDVCGKKFGSKTYQVIHTLRHQGIRNKQFSCEICNKEFEDKATLKRHQFLRHTDVWPFSCDQCGRRFKLRQTLTIHIIHHSDIRPYVCEICGSGHKTYGERTNHMKLHNNYEHWCDYCGSQFTCKSSVARHIFGYCKKSGQKRISTKKLGFKI